MDRAFAAQHFLPHLFRDEGRDRGQQQAEGLECLAPGSRRHRFPLPCLLQEVRPFHQRGDGRVELERFHIVRHPANGTVLLADECLFGGGRRARRRPPARLAARDRVGQCPEAVQKAGDSFDSTLIPGDICLKGADENDIGAQGVGAMGLRNLIRGHDVSPRLGHARAIGRVQHALVAQCLERFDEIDQPRIVHHLGPEARI